MKKFTLLAIAALVAMVTFAQKPRQPQKASTISIEQTQIKAKAVARQSTIRKAPRRTLGLIVPPESAIAETYYTVSGTLYVYNSGWQAVNTPESVQVIVDGSDIYIAGLAYYVEDAWIKGTIEGTTATFPAAQQVDDDEQYPEWISGSNDGGSLCDIVFDFDQEAGTLKCVTQYIGECASEDLFSLYAYWVKPSFLKEQPEVVVLPDWVETEAYTITARNYNDDADVYVPLKIGFDGNNVYIQGLATYLPEAWIKGTIDGTTITFPTGQYLGNYYGYNMFLNVLSGDDVVFDYDEVTGTLTAQNELFLIDNSDYYFDAYRYAVITKDVEKAAIPANPEITELTETNSYGYVIDFNIPLVDINGEPLSATKLYYMIYTDVEGEIAPLTFTPTTHTMLTEDMVEIPYGFTENWDFYSTRIYLNELYSEDWNNIGIQSIYVGGGEYNATEIQWFHIKDYTVNSATFDFNKMDIATSSSSGNDGDITEEITFTEGNVTLAISPKDGNITENRFWSTSWGPQLRIYSGTLTLTANGEEPITKIVFNHNGKWGDNTIEGKVIPNDTEANVATWNGDAQQVVVNIAANSQINSIEVTTTGDVLVTLPVGVEAEDWALEGFYHDGSYGFDVFFATEVAFDGTDIYVKGLAYYFEDAWLKGTLDSETGIATFPQGQFVGEDDYGKEYMHGYDSDICDIQYAYDADAKTLTQITPTVLESKTRSGFDEEGELAFWGDWEVSYLHAGAPTAVEEVEVPEGLVTESYAFSAQALESGEEQPKEYSYQLQVGFDGNDVYFKGFSDNTADMWAKGTLSEDGKTVTIPASQYLGTLSQFGYVFDYYLTAIDDGGEYLDIVFNYDAATNTFSTDQTVMLNGSMFVYYPYQNFWDVTITKVPELAVTPADPSIDGYVLVDTTYPYINFVIPAKDTEGNDILTSKLFYTVWFDIDGVEQPFEVLAGEYKYVEEDWTEIPYDWDDNFDIYKGGSMFYINPTDVIPFWKRIGIQSIYYGGGERNASNIVWMDNPAYDPATGIKGISHQSDDKPVYNLNGQRLSKPMKGINIIGGRKELVK